MGYAIPADAPVSSSWADHKNRNPPSAEPGTDYACGYGTGIACAGNGRVADRKTDNGGGTGRYLTIDLDDGRRVRYLHLSQIYLNVGDRVSYGDEIAASGASGYGNDWYYGPHVHVTLFPQQNYDFSSTIDFALYAEDDEVDKQGVKDAMYEFYRDVGAPPPGQTEWQFIRQSVWNQGITAQDVDGLPVKDDAGNYVRYAADGYLASINASVQDMRTNPVGVAGHRALIGILSVIGVLGVVQLGILIAVLANLSG